MKLGLGSLALAATIAGPAMAADIPVKAAPPPPAVVYNWSGVYAGISAGAVWAEVDRHYPNLGLFGIQQDYTSKNSDPIVGFHLGAQAQWGNVVLGVEAILNSGINPLESRVILPNTIFGPTFSTTSTIGNLFTVGPRLGYAWDRWMVFGTGGYASATIKGGYINVTTGLPTFPPGVNLSGQTRNSGWFAGGGIEYMVHKGTLADVIFGVEYQHFDLRPKRAFTDTIFFNAPVTFDQGASGDIVRARLTVKTQGFPWWGR